MRRVLSTGLLGLAAAAVGAAAIALAADDRPMQPLGPNAPAVEPQSTLPMEFPGERSAEWLQRDPGVAGLQLTVDGRLVGVDASELVVDRGGGELHRITVLPDTSFYLGGIAVTRDQLPEGARVRAAYRLDGLERIGLRVEVEPPGVPAEAPVPAAPGAVPLPEPATAGPGTRPGTGP